MHWYMLTLSAADLDMGKESACKEEFENNFVAAHGPREMALFQRGREDGGMDLFFTPDSGKYAAGLLERWHCSPCDRPSLIGLHLLVGHSEITYYMP